MLDQEALGASHHTGHIDRFDEFLQAVQGLTRDEFDQLFFSGFDRDSPTASAGSSSGSGGGSNLPGDSAQAGCCIII